MIIVITSRSGGVSKSTTALHLAHGLAQDGPTQVWDLDQNRICSKWRERCPAPPIFDVNEPGGIDGYVHTIIDTAAAPGESELAELATAADLLIVPTTCSAYDVDPAIATWAALQDLGTPIKFMLALAPPRPSKAAEQAHNDLQAGDLPVFDQWITRRNCYIEAANTGKTVFDIKTASAKAAATEWSVITQEVLSYG